MANRATVTSPAVRNGFTRDGITSDIDLRGQFHDPLPRALSHMTPVQREIFGERVRACRDTAIEQDDNAARHFDRQRNAEELLLHRNQNAMVMAALEAGNAPPALMSNQDLLDLAHETTLERQASMQARVNAQVRAELNTHLERVTGLSDVLPERFDAVRDIEMLEAAIDRHSPAPQVSEAHDMEPEL